MERYVPEQEGPGAACLPVFVGIVGKHLQYQEVGNGGPILCFMPVSRLLFGLLCTVT